MLTSTVVNHDYISKGQTIQVALFHVRCTADSRRCGFVISHVTESWLSRWNTEWISHAVCIRGITLTENLDAVWTEWLTRFYHADSRKITDNVDLFFLKLNTNFLGIGSWDIGLCSTSSHTAAAATREKAALGMTYFLTVCDDHYQASVPFRSLSDGAEQGQVPHFSVALGSGS